MKQFIKQEFIPKKASNIPLWPLSEMHSIDKSEEIIVSSNGKKEQVYTNKFFSFVNVVVESFDATIIIDVLFLKASDIKIKGIKENQYYVKNRGEVKITFPEEGRAVLEPDDDLTNALYITVSRRIEKPENISYYFRKGNIYNIGNVQLNSGDTVYIEDGAIVSGYLSSNGADDIKIIGNGILYGGNWHEEEGNGGERLIALVGGNNIDIEGITLLDGGSWHLVPIGCKNVHINNVNILGKVITGDGIDIVGCNDVLIENSFIRANDDCISIKASGYMDSQGNQNTHNVVVNNCLFWNAEFGNALEIGYETTCDEISHIYFNNCRILHCEYEGNQSGGCLTIHDADRAFVHDIHYENIVIEDAQEKFVDIKVLDSKYSSDTTRGKISNVYFRNISVLGDKFPVSIIRGFEMKHEVSRPTNIYFDNVTVCNKHVMNFRDLHLIKELTDDVYFL